MAEIFASIDLGGTNIKCALGNAQGEVIARKSVPTESHRGPEGVIDRMADLVNDIAAENDIKPAGLGIGVPGLCDLPNGIVKFVPNMPTQWPDVPVRDLLQPQVNCPVYLLNDVRIATLGELTFGHGQGVDTMVFCALGTGIGGGVVINGKLRLGPLGAAGEIGHQTILPDGPLCGCGSRGCLETLASGPALIGMATRLMRSGQTPKLHEITGGDDNKIDCKTIEDAARGGDGKLLQGIANAGEYLGIGMANLIVALHPDLIVIGGGVALTGDILLNPMKEEIRNRVHMLPPETVEIKTSKLGDQAGALGGIALAMKQGQV